MQANEYYNWTRAKVTETFTARHWNVDILSEVRFRKGDEVRLESWRPEGMMAKNMRTGEMIFLFFENFVNLRQMTING